jgi:hypothetical protein
MQNVFEIIAGVVLAVSGACMFLGRWLKWQWLDEHGHDERDDTPWH